MPSEKKMICSNCGKQYPEWMILPTGVCVACARLLAVIPPVYLDKSFDNFVVGKNQKAVEKCKAFDKSERGLFLYGSPGAGKTHLAIAVLKNIIKSGKEIKIAIMPNVFLALRDTFSKNEGLGEADILDYYSSGCVLFDDFALEKQSPFCLTTVYTLLNNRWISGQHKIIITSNLSIGEISQTMSDRLASRISGMCDLVQVVGEDRRVRGKNG
jgi:DNA replication protein DnaC